MSTLGNGLKALFLTALFSLGTLGLAGCDEGRFEEAGEEVDQAGEEMQDEIDEAGDEM